jgi:DNA polymerase elongation subunit (family B)
MKKMYLWELDAELKTNKVVDDYSYDVYVSCDENDSEKSEFRSIDNKPVKKKTIERPKDIEFFRDMGMSTYQSDVPEATIYLQNRYRDKKIDPSITNFNIATVDIEIASENEFPEPAEAKYPINLITSLFSKQKKVITWGLNQFTGDFETIKKLTGDSVEFEYRFFADETEMLNDFISVWRKQKVDIITGWKVKNFDIHYILNRCNNLGVDKSLSPINKVSARLTTDSQGQENYSCTIAGLIILDYNDLYKKFTFTTLESYSLNFVSMFEGVGGKLDFEGQINDIYKTNWNRFVEYNIQDVMLVVKLEQKLKFIQLAVRMASEALCPIDKVFSSVAVITGFILRKLHKKKLVLDDRKSDVLDWWHQDKLYITEDGLQNVLEGNKTFEPFAVKGGHVEASPNLYEYVQSYDVESLYPHNIMMFNISPETKVYNPSKSEIESHNLIRTPINGVYYKRQKGILPEIVETIFKERKMFKEMMFTEEKLGNKELASYYDSQQHIRKILINSMYGVLANKYFHLFDVDNARVVTRAGRNLIRYLKKSTNTYFKEYWHKVAKKYFPESTYNEPLKNDIVVVLDTDSLYLCLSEIKNNYAPDMDFLKFSEIMENEFFTNFFNKVLKIYADNFGVDQIINFKREGVILKQFVLAKKKYLTLIIQNEKKVYDQPKLKVTGVEIKRSDTPQFCREKIESVVDFIFKTTDRDKTIELLKEIKKEFKMQDISKISSNSSVQEYTKYAKETSEYVKNNEIQYRSSTPMHVRAAMNYNYTIKKNNFPYLEIGNGSKLKYIFVKESNFLEQNVIAFIGNYPDEFQKIFKIDYDTQFEKTFLSVVQRMFDVLNWGEINLKDSGKLKKFFE